jgi:hypothetical protein
MAEPGLDLEKYRIWEARRREYAQRTWISALVLVPAAFAALAGLTRISCPGPMDFAVLGGVSAALLAMLAALTERFRSRQMEAAAKLAEFEGAGAEPAAHRSGRLEIAAVAVALTALYAAAWSLRPDCESQLPPEDPELTTRL